MGIKYRKKGFPNFLLEVACPEHRGRTSFCQGHLIGRGHQFPEPFALHMNMYREKGEKN